MCYNAEVSIITYLVALIGCIMLIRNKYYIEAAFYFWVIQMQLVEYVLWENQNCNNINKITTNIGMFINNVQPIILWIAIYFFSKKIIPMWIHYLIIVYILFTIIYSYKIIKTKSLECTLTAPFSNNHLYWKWNTGEYSYTYYLLFLFLLFVLCIYGVEQGIYMSLLINIGFLLTYLIYNKYNVNGAMWCYYAAFAPFLTLILYN